LNEEQHQQAAGEVWNSL